MRGYTNRDAEAGFTILELMVVVAISTILAVMATPSLLNVYRRATLNAEGRRLYGAFVEAQGMATSTGARHRLFLDRGNRLWSIDADDGAGGWRTIKAHGEGVPGQEGWPSHIELGPQGGIAPAFPAPYATVTRNAWCTPCGAGNDNGAIIFDIDGRVLDPATDEPVSGSVFLHSTAGLNNSPVMALVFVGATGNVRLFDTTE